jgi:acyl-CoA thioesterase FadM
VSLGEAAEAPADDLEATLRYRTRFDECGPDGLIRTSALLRYAQDVAWVHSERLGFDRGWYGARGLAWLVRSVDIELRARVLTGRTLEVTTRVVGFRRVSARRRTTFRDEGDVVAEVLTDWAMTNERGVPVRIPPDFERFVAVALEFRPTKVALVGEPTGATRTEVEVRPQDIDPMDHVNNAAYVDYVEEVLLAIPAAAGIPRTVPRRYVLDYALPASLGERIRLTAWPGDAGWNVRLTTLDGTEVARVRVSA